MNTNDAVLIAGGYGVVGQQAAQVIRQRHPDLPLIIGGRNPAKAETLVRELTNVTIAMLDVEQCNDPLELDTHDSSCTIGPGKGKLNGQATNVQTRVQGTVGTRRADRRQKHGGDLPRAPAEAASLLAMESRASGTSA